MGSWSVSNALALKVLKLSLESKGQCKAGHGDHFSVSINPHLSVHIHIHIHPIKIFLKTTLALPSLQLPENTMMAVIDP